VDQIVAIAYKVDFNPLAYQNSGWKAWWWKGALREPRIKARGNSI